MPLDSQLPEPPPEPLELWEMFDQVAPSTWAEHQRMTFDLAARVLKLAFQLSAMCSQCSRSDDPTEAHAAVELADLHACNFLFAMLHRSLSTFRYVDLSTEKKHVKWHTVRRCADALRTVLARRPRPPPMVAASFKRTLMFAEGAPMLLRPSASTDGHEDGFAMLRALTKVLRALTDPRLVCKALDWMLIAYLFNAHGDGGKMFQRVFQLLEGKVHFKVWPLTPNPFPLFDSR